MSKYKRNYSNQTKQSKEKNEGLFEKELKDLDARIAAETPDKGYAPPLHQQVAFRALPLSENTLRGLEAGKKTKFITMTAIQHACIPHALIGRDVLGAARTGSGKTLAFLIPILERLYRERYSASDGPGAIVLSPTRELAVQTFEVLRQIGSYHTLSAGLLVGGKKEFHLEQRHVGKTNILIATPGRLLQHLEQTPNFDTDGVLMLILDEADRILDMGFRDQMIRILDYLPSGDGRQTLLFSATQTRRVSDLAALSLRKPEYLGVHDKEKSSTPDSLQQSVVTVPLEHKLNMVHSFIKSHLKNKTIVFFASCSQIRYVWELFCSLQPGIPVMALHGKLLQERRTKIYFDFLQRPHAVLFATDVAARGLDFPDVDWVVQMDAPEDKDMYIHRVGRTARYNKGGKSLLCVTPGEEPTMTKSLQDAKVPYKRLTVNPDKTVLVTQRAASLVASNPRLNELAKKAFKSYVRSIHLMPNKDMFKVTDLNLDGFASSLGLASAPNPRFLAKLKDREHTRDKKNVNHKLHKLKEQIKAEKLAKKIEKMGDQVPEKKRRRDHDTEEDDLLVIKARHNVVKDDGSSDEENLPDPHLHEVAASRHPKKIRIERAGGQNTRIMFNDDGEEEEDGAIFRQDAKELEASLQQDKGAIAAASEDYLRKVRERLDANVEKDRTEEKERIREKHRKIRLKEKGDKEAEGDEDEDVMVTLGGVEADDEGNQSESGSPSGNSSASEESDDDSASQESEVDLKAQEDMALAMIRNNM